MEVQSSIWNGLLLKELLDKVDPSTNNMNGQEMKAKAELERAPAPESAYLGPKLWEKPISLQQFNEDDFFVMNIDDFLAENDIQKEKFGNALKENEQSPEPEDLKCTLPSNLTIKPNPDSPAMMEAMSPCSMSSAPSPCSSASPRYAPPSCSPVYAPSPRPGVIVSTKDCKKNVLPKGENTFLYAESKRARIEREKAEKRARLEVDLEFSPEDLALATVPGADFDPRERSFEVEELRPQPIIRKRPKLFVSDQEKDDKYWEKRGKNNVAARRSREARRLKENQIALRAAFLEKENSVLKRRLDEANFENSKLAMERAILQKKLAKYENFM